MTTRQSIRRYQVAGFAALTLLVAGFGGWSAVASISSAVLAEGQVVVETSSSTVQHLEGGLIAAIEVAEGDRVAAGDVLVRLDDTETRAQLGIIRARIDALSAKQARLDAESAGLQTIAFPDDLIARQDDPDVAGLIQGQERLFSATRVSARGREQQLQQRVGQLVEEIVGLEAQLASKREQARLIKSELADLSGLREKGLVPESRVSALRREAARLEGEHGQLIAQIARTRGQINETQLQILSIDQDGRAEALKELREVQAQLAELVEKRIAAQARLRRIDVVAPRSGYVHQLSVHTIGGVIGPGQALMQIVPENESLVVEARVGPRDIDQVSVGLTAQARFSALDANDTPELNGLVGRVAADLTQDPATGEQYYLIRVAIDDAEKARLGGQRLLPGMPVEIFITTGSRTALNYLLKPLTDQIARAFREG